MQFGFFTVFSLVLCVHWFMSLMYYHYICRKELSISFFQKIITHRTFKKTQKLVDLHVTAVLKPIPNLQTFKDFLMLYLSILILHCIIVI